jgi:hypothetical protein
MTTKQKAAKPAAPAAGNHHSKAFEHAARSHAGRSDDGDAFIPDPHGGPAHTDDDLAEELGEDFIAAAISGETSAEDTRDAEVMEELGGPFIYTDAKTEFADGTDLSNPEGAEPAAFPTATGTPSDDE